MQANEASHRYYKMKKRQLWDWGIHRDSSVQAACDTSIARTIIIITFHLADISIVILSIDTYFFHQLVERFLQ